MRKIRFGCVAAFLMAAGCALGPSSFDFTVSAGQHERNNVPVKVPVSSAQVPGEQFVSVTLTRADGRAIPAQWTGPSLGSTSGGELHFILPHLAAGKSARFKAVLSPDSKAGAARFAWRDHAGQYVDL